MKKGETTKQYIIKQSAVLFNVYGYHKCSMSDIMQATGLQKGGLYNHFSNKDEIAYQAFEYSYNLVFDRFRSALKDLETPKEKLKTIVDVLVNSYYEPFIEGGCPIFNTAMQSTDAYPELRAKSIDAVEMLNNYVAIKITEGVNLGQFNETIDPLEAATFIISSLEGALIMSRLFNGDQHIKRVEKMINEFIELNIISK